MAEIFSIVYQPNPSVDESPYRYHRVPVDQATLIINHGIEGDLKAGHHPNRNLNVMAHETLEVLRSEGFKTDPGEMGEQLILRGVDIMALSSGDRLQLANEARIEIRKPRTGCAWFEKVQRKPRAEAANRLGVMAKVIRGGVIRVGDPVYALEPVDENPDGT